jgi:hypothetical protein
MNACMDHYRANQNRHRAMRDAHDRMVRAALPEGAQYDTGLYGIVRFKDDGSVDKFATFDCHEIPEGVLTGYVDAAGFLGMVPDPGALGFDPLPCPYESFFMENEHRNLGEYVGHARHICEYVAQDEISCPREFNRYYRRVQGALLELLDSHARAVPTTGDLPWITFVVGLPWGRRQ